MGYVEDVKNLLEKPDTKYEDLLRLLISLEREHATIITKIKMGLSEDIEATWKIAKIADRLIVKILKKLNQ